MQATSSLGQNIADDIKGSIPISSQQNIPGTSSLSTGQAPYQSFSGIQEKSPLGFQQQPLQGQQFQQNLPAQQYSNLQGQQNLQNQQYSNLQGQQNLQNQQQYSNLQGQQQMGYQQGLSSQQFDQQNLQNQQQFLPQQQSLESQKFLNQQQPFQQWFPQQQKYTQQSFLQQGQLLPATQIQVAPAILEHKDFAPIVHERIRREEVEEIHPVIHREREKTEIHKITQPVHTSAVLGVVTEEATLPAKFSEMRTPSMLPPANILPRREELTAQKMRVESAPVVIETERKKIIEEVTPLVYREVVEPHLTKLTQPIYERIVEGDVYVSEIRPAQVMATSMECSTAIPLQQSTQFVQQTQNVPVQIPVVHQMPILTKNLEFADTYVKEGIPITTTNRGLFGRRAV
jgi:hypothetical protein